MIDSMLTLTYLFLRPLGNPDTEGLFKLNSPAFANHQLIPYSYTCFGKGQPIPLHWEGIPKGTKSLVIIMTDQDVPRQSQYYHWAAFNIPANLDHFSGHMPLAENSWGKQAYQPPCPKAGIHHYQIRLYALNTLLPIEAKQDPITLRKNMQHHILATTDLNGRAKSIQ